MTETYPLQRAFICFFGVTPLYERTVMLDMLASFESDNKLTPTKWGLDERDVKNEYLSRSVLGNLNENKPLTHDLYISRTKTIKYRCTFWLGQRSGLIIEFDKNLTRSNWDKVFEFADKLANVYRPDIGTVYFSPAFDLYGTDQKNIDLRLILTSAFLYPAEYYQIGPKGLGNRTYIGDYYRRVFSEHCFDLLPGNVKRLDWGGLRVDLLPEVVPQNEDELISAWKANMNVLWSDQVFANCDVTNRGEFNFKRGANCSIR